MSKSLAAQNKDLASPKVQMEYLNNGVFGDGALPTFKKKLQENHL